MASSAPVASSPRLACSEVPPLMRCTCGLCTGEPTEHARYLHLAITIKLYKELHVTLQRKETEFWPAILEWHRTGSDTDILYLNPRYTPSWSNSGTDPLKGPYSPVIGECTLVLTIAERKVAGSPTALMLSLSKRIREGLKRRLESGKRLKLALSQAQIWDFFIFALIGHSDALAGKRELTVRWIAHVSKERVDRTIYELRGAPPCYPDSVITYAFLWPAKDQRSRETLPLITPVLIQDLKPTDPPTELTEQEENTNSGSVHQNESGAAGNVTAGSSSGKLQRAPARRRINSRVITSEDELDELEEDVNKQPREKAGKSSSALSTAQKALGSKHKANGDGATPSVRSEQPAIVDRAEPKKGGSSWRPAMARRTPSATGPNPPFGGRGNAVGGVAVPEHLWPNRPSSATTKPAEEAKRSAGATVDKNAERVHALNEPRHEHKRKAVSPIDSSSDLMERRNISSSSVPKKAKLSSANDAETSSKGRELGAARHRVAGSSKSKPPARHQYVFY